MNYNLIGAGRLGLHLIHALNSLYVDSLLAICNRTEQSALNVINSVKSGYAVKSISQLPSADITWICCRDDSIEDVVSQLYENPFLKTGSMVVHCSGVLSSSVLAPLKERGCLTASIHPLKAFTHTIESNPFNKVYCVLEGDEQTCRWVHTCFNQLGAILIPISAQSKPLYHAGACIASNYLITLAACSEELFIEAGIHPNQAKEMICQLMQSNIKNILNTSIPEALTGPIARGDHKTVLKHIDSGLSPEMKNLYIQLGLATLALTQLDEAALFSIQEILKSRIC